MNAPQPRPQSPLQAVPPSQMASVAPTAAAFATPAPPTTTMPPTSPLAAPALAPPWRRWAIGAGVVLGLVAIGHIPLSPPVWTEGKLRVPDNGNYRQPVYADAVGKVVKVYVASGDSVRIGQQLIELELPEVNEKITNLTTEIAKQDVSLQDARSRYQSAQGRIAEIRAQLSIASHRMDRSRLRANRDQAPEVGVYQAEIQELRAKKETLRGQAEDTEELIAIARRGLERQEEAIREGAISENRLDELQKELKRYQRELRSYHDQIREIDRKILAPSAKVAIARQSLGDDSIDRAGELQQIQAALVAAIAEKTASQASIDRVQRVIDRYRQERDRLIQDRDKYRIIEATRDGRVDGSDLTSKLNAQVDEKEKLLEIVNLETLQVPVEIDQSDRDVVHTGMKAKIRPLQSNQQEQTAELKADESVVRQDATQQKRQLLYFATVDNRDGSLRQGEKVYVTVLTEPMPLYQVIGRELHVLFKLRQFFNF